MHSTVDDGLFSTTFNHFWFLWVFRIVLSSCSFCLFYLCVCIFVDFGLFIYLFWRALYCCNFFTIFFLLYLSNGFKSCRFSPLCSDIFLDFHGINSLNNLPMMNISILRYHYSHENPPVKKIYRDCDSIVSSQKT